MTEIDTSNTTQANFGQTVKSQIQEAEQSLCDILDVAGILGSLAGGELSGDVQLESTQIYLLSRLLRELATTAYNIIAVPKNWAPEARRAQYAPSAAEAVQ